VRGVGDLELAAQQIGCRHGGLAHGLAGSVDNVPLTLDVALFAIKVDMVFFLRLKSIM